MVHNAAGFIWRRNLFFSERGFARIAMRDYRIVGKYSKVDRIVAPQHPGLLVPDWEKLARNRDSKERRAMLVNFLARFVVLYPKSGGCALPSCCCIAHELGLPKKDLVDDLLTKRRY